MKIKNFATTVLLIFCSTLLMAHGDAPDFFRSIGKMYVVVAVMVATFLGIIAFMVYIERKIKNIEKEISSHK